MVMTTIEDLAAFAADLSFDRIPESVLGVVRRHLLDAIGCALASAAASAGGPVIELVRAGAGAREAGILGFEFRAPASQAALATGTLIHALDYDDSHVFSIVHPSAAVVPAALAAAEEAGGDGRVVAVALAAGYEVACRMGLAMRESISGHGLDPTGFAGPYGAAAAAGRVWGLTQTQMTNALGLAGALSGGIVGGRAGTSDVMRIRGGWAAQTGVIAADLARRGLIGPADIAEGLHNLVAEPQRAVSNLESHWESLRIAIKPYPACHFVHAYADAAASLTVKPGEVGAIICVVHPSIVNVVCEPRAQRSAPQSDTEARFSLPFAVASAMIGGRQPLELFGEDARNDRRILSLAERVRFETDATLPFPSQYGGRLIVSLKDGRTREAVEEINRGHPDRPLTDDELHAKFYSNARKRIENPAAAKLAGEIRRIEELDDVEEIVSLAQMR
ncbi:MAG: MmgE/PrpD family protein [Actinomycetota bacterium]